TRFSVVSVYLNTQADQHGRDNFDAFVRRGLKTRAKRRPMRTMSHLQKLLNRLATVDAPAPKTVSEIHVLKGKDDLSECLSRIQVSCRFSDLRHRKCLIHYRSVFPLCGQSYHLIGVLRRALLRYQKDVEPDDRGRLPDEIKRVDCQARSSAVSEVNQS